MYKVKASKNYFCGRLVKKNQKRENQGKGVVYLADAAYVFNTDWTNCGST
jgi:hypothetical protein